MVAKTRVEARHVTSSPILEGFPPSLSLALVHTAIMSQPSYTLSAAQEVLRHMLVSSTDMAGRDLTCSAWQSFMFADMQH